jgi:NAD(P)-dependent dehydrogenase (short-subunit alcohol dehydrogenase family)
MAEFDLVQPQHRDTYDFISPSGGLQDASLNKSVLIVGAGSGIGKAAAHAFAATGASNVVITGRRAANLEDVKNAVTKAFPKTRVLAIPADAADPAGVDKLFSEIADASITLDVLVNSQGITRSKASIRNSDPEDWWADWEVMVRSPYLTTRAFLRSLPEPAERPSHPTRAVVNLSSLGSNILLPQHTSYGPPKAAINRITEWIAAEGTLLGVQAVCYHPGGVADTDITSKSGPHMKAYYTETAELAALTAVYLSTPKASYLTGRYIDARWDLGELENHKDRIVEEDLLKTAILGHARLDMGPDIRGLVEKL